MSLREPSEGAFEERIGGRSFPHEQIAEEVIWPLVKSAWHGRDFREGSNLLSYVEIQDNRILDDVEYEVCLQAFNEKVLIDEGASDGGTKTVSTAELDVGRVVFDERRGLILDEAWEHNKSIEDYDINALFTLVASSYAFNTEGELEVGTRRRLEKSDGTILWDSGVDITEYTEVTTVRNQDGTESQLIVVKKPEYKIHAGDLELIEAGIWAINAPRAIRRVLSQIKGGRHM